MQYLQVKASNVLRLPGNVMKEISRLIKRAGTKGQKAEAEKRERKEEAKPNVLGVWKQPERKKRQSCMSRKGKSIEKKAGEANGY